VDHYSESRLFGMPLAPNNRRGDEAMKTMNGRKNDQPHVEKNSIAWETQAIISSGEELLFRAHKVAHEIEQHIREVLARSERDSSKS
jgi:hypothetical protein